MLKCDMTQWVSDKKLEFLFATNYDNYDNYDVDDNYDNNDINNENNDNKVPQTPPRHLKRLIRN